MCGHTMFKSLSGTWKSSILTKLCVRKQMGHYHVLDSIMLMFIFSLPNPILRTGRYVAFSSMLTCGTIAAGKVLRNSLLDSYEYACLLLLPSADPSLAGRVTIPSEAPNTQTSKHPRRNRRQLINYLTGAPSNN